MLIISLLPFNPRADLLTAGSLHPSRTSSETDVLWLSTQHRDLVALLLLYLAFGLLSPWGLVLPCKQQYKIHPLLACQPSHISHRYMPFVPLEQPSVLSPFAVLPFFLSHSRSAAGHFAGPCDLLYSLESAPLLLSVSSPRYAGKCLTESIKKGNAAILIN